MTVDEYITHLSEWADENDAGGLTVYSGNKRRPAVNGPPYMLVDEVWRWHGNRVLGSSIARGVYVPSKNGSTVRLSDGPVAIIYGPQADWTASDAEDAQAGQ